MFYFVCGTMSPAKLSLHWSVIHYQVTSDILGVFEVQKRLFSCALFIFRCKVTETVSLDKVPEELSKLEDTRIGKVVMVNSR